MLNDLRYLLRLVRKSPNAFAIAVLTLAIGIGANAGIFSVIRAVVLKPLPYADADRLVALAERWPTVSGPKPISRLNYRDWVTQNTVFERIAANSWGDATMSSGDVPLRVEASLVSPAYFDVFGLHAALGRTFAPDEDQPGREKVVLLSHQLWVTQFGGDRAVIGQSIRLDGESYAIVGVMPAGASVDFGFDLSNPQIWRPLPLDAPPPRGAYDLRLVAAKMKAGVTLEQAAGRWRPSPIGWPPSIPTPTRATAWSCGHSRVPSDLTSRVAVSVVRRGSRRPAPRVRESGEPRCRPRHGESARSGDSFCATFRTMLGPHLHASAVFGQSRDLATAFSGPPYPRMGLPFRDIDSSVPW